MLRATRAPGLMAGATLVVFSIQTLNAQTAPAPEPGLDINLTANRSPTEIQRTGSAITIVPGDEIRKASPASISDALRTIPGVTVTETGGPGGTTTVSLRGANAGQTLVLVDGVRVNDSSAGSGEFDFSVLAPGLIDRIEVLRGPQSALYGSDALGGVINIITKRGRGPFKTYAQAEGGSYGTASGNAAIYGGQGAWSYSLGASALRTDGFSRYGDRVGRVTRRFRRLEADGLNRYGGYGRIGFDPGTGFRFEIASMATFSRVEYDAAFGTFPDTGSKSNQLFHTSFAKAELDTFDRRLKNTLTIYGNRTARDYRSVSFGATQTPADTFLDKNSFVGARVGAEYQGNLALDRFGSLIFGGKVERETIESFSESLLPAIIPRTKDIDRGQNTKSLFALWQVPLGERLDVSLGGRIDDVQRSAIFRTWRATAAYRILETGTKLRASVGTGGKAPTLYQLYAPFFGTPTLRAEKSFGYDFGFDQTLAGGRAKITASVFYNRFNNLIDFDFGTFTFQNIARAESWGVEAGGETILWDDYLTLRTSYTFLQARDRLTNQRLARRPAHNGKIAFAITPWAGWTIEPSVQLVSKRFSSTNETQRLAPYARFDMLVDYKVSEHLNVYLRGENLTNARYQEVTDYGTAGRSVYAGLRSTW